MMMARLSLLKCLPRLASMAPFLCLIVAQWECPDMAPPQCGRLGARSLLTGCRVGGVFATHLCCQSPKGGFARTPPTLRLISNHAGSVSATGQAPNSRIIQLFQFAL